MSKVISQLKITVPKITVSKRTGALLVDFLIKIVDFLWNCSPLNIIKSKCVDSSKHSMVTEIWVFSFLLLSIDSFIFAPTISQSNFNNIVTGFIIVLIRIFFILISGIRIPLYHARFALSVEDSERSLVLFSMNFVEIIVWFGVAYRCLYEFTTKEIVIHWWEFLHFSFTSATGIGLQDLTDLIPKAMLFSFAESIIGFLMIVFVLARFILEIPKENKYKQS
jgi:hypothetical protein